MIVVERKAADVLALKGMGVDLTALEDGGRIWAGETIKKPWGSEYELYRQGALSIWRLVLEAGGETSMHCHPRKRTVLMVEQGQCVIETLAGLHEMRAGDIAHIEAGAFHRTRAQGPTILLEVETPPNKLDIVRLEDRYGRAGKGYACA